MEEFPYVMAWLAYLVGAVGLAAVFWRMTRNFRLRRTRRSVRALVAVILFTPINIATDNEVWLAPAYLVGAYDWVLGHADSAVRAGVYMAAAYCFLIVCVFFESVMRRLMGMEKAA